MVVPRFQAAATPRGEPGQCRTTVDLPLPSVAAVALSCYQDKTAGQNGCDDSCVLTHAGLGGSVVIHKKGIQKTSTATLNRTVRCQVSDLQRCSRASFDEALAFVRAGGPDDGDQVDEREADDNG
jgi:hypothetical protein